MTFLAEYLCGYHNQHFKGYARRIYLLWAETRFASRLAFIEATVVSRNRRPACSAVPRLSSLNPVWIGATTTLMFSSPVLPGGPYAASGSATAFLDLSNQKGGTSAALVVKCSQHPGLCSQSHSTL